MLTAKQLLELPYDLIKAIQNEPIEITAMEMNWGKGAQVTSQYYDPETNMLWKFVTIGDLVCPVGTPQLEESIFNEED